MTERNPFQALAEEAPQVSQAFNSLIQAVSTAGGLDAKTRQLIFIGIMASKGDSEAVAAHVPMARQQGAAREEIRDAILLALPSSGLQSVTHCLIPALEAYDRCTENL